jgi:hypothetical protein
LQHLVFLEGVGEDVVEDDPVPVDLVVVPKRLLRNSTRK